MNYDWNFNRVFPYTQAFVAGTVTTLSLTFIVVISGTIFGVILGLILHNPFARLILYPIIDIIRALPPLVLILFLYFVLTPQVTGMTVPAYWVAALALSFNLAAFTADLVRAAVENVPKNALDAGRALAMSRRNLTRYILLPYVAREIMPAMISLSIGVLKLSALASVINVSEVVYAAQTVITETSRSLETWAVVACIYVLLVLPSTYAARYAERWLGHEGGIQRL